MRCNASLISSYLSLTSSSLKSQNRHLLSTGLYYFTETIQVIQFHTFHFISNFLPQSQGESLFSKVNSLTSFNSYYSAPGRGEKEKHIVEFNSLTPNFSLVGKNMFTLSLSISSKILLNYHSWVPSPPVIPALEVLYLSIQKSKPPFLVLSPEDHSVSPILNCLHFHTVLSLFVLSI